MTRLQWRLSMADLRHRPIAKVTMVLSLLARLGFGILVGSGAYAASTSRWRTDAAILVPSGLALLGVFVTLISGVRDPFDLGVVATLPLRRRDLTVGPIIASAAGPFVVFFVPAFVGTVLGYGFGVHGLLVVVAVVVLTLMLLSFNRVVANWLAMLLRRFERNAKVLIGLLTVVLYFGFQVVSRVHVAERTWHTLARYGRWTPPGMLGNAIHLAKSSPVRTAGLIVAGTVMSIALVQLHAVTTQRLLVGKSGGGAGSSSKAVGVDRRWATIRRLCGTGRSGAVAVRNIKLRLRSPRGIVELITGMTIGVVGAVFAVWKTGAEPRSALSIATLGTGPLLSFGNSFGITGVGLEAEVLAGVDARTLVNGTFRGNVLISLLPLPITALGITLLTGGWSYLPIALLVGLASVLAGNAAAVAQSAISPVPAPADGSPFATAGLDGQGCVRGLAVLALWLVAGLVFLPAVIVGALAIRGTTKPTLIAIAIALAAAGAAALVLGGLAVARWRLRGREAQLVNEVRPKR
jgi:hypothetical protein